MKIFSSDQNVLNITALFTDVPSHPHIVPLLLRPLLLQVPLLSGQHLLVSLLAAPALRPQTGLQLPVRVDLGLEINQINV